MKNWPPWALWPFVVLAVAFPAFYGFWRVIADPNKAPIDTYPASYWLLLIFAAVASFLGMVALSYLFKRPVLWPWVAIIFGVITATRGLVEAFFESWNTETLGDTASGAGAIAAGILLLLRAAAARRELPGPTDTSQSAQLPTPTPTPKPHP